MSGKINEYPTIVELNEIRDRIMEGPDHPLSDELVDVIDSLKDFIVIYLVEHTE